MTTKVVYGDNLKDRNEIFKDVKEPEFEQKIAALSEKLTTFLQENEEPDMVVILALQNMILFLLSVNEDLDVEDVVATLQNLMKYAVLSAPRVKEQLDGIRKERGE